MSGSQVKQTHGYWNLRFWEISNKIPSKFQNFLFFEYVDSKFMKERRFESNRFVVFFFFFIDHFANFEMYIAQLFLAL